MSTQHTPGPWHVANGVQIRSERHQVAKVWMMRNGEGTANARVIAAAPDLLARLKAAANYIDTLGGDSRECRIAIATAEGKS